MSTDPIDPSDHSRPTRGMLNRRTFLAASAAALGGAAAPLRAVQGVGDERPTADATALAPLPRTTLGRTGRVLPRLGFGAYPIARLSEDEAVPVVRRAIDLGVRYFDTAPSYGRGKSEKRIGLALAESGVDRGDFFIATKTLRRDGAGARRELEESLTRLGVEYVDALQVHEVHDDVETLFGPAAALAALEQAREEGLIRHIGITGHRNPKHLIAAMRRYEFATALVPINPLDPKYFSFVHELLPVAAERNVAVIAMKVYAGGSLLAGDAFTAGELLRYALSQPHVSIAVPGCDRIAYVDEARGAVGGFKPLTGAEMAALEKRAGVHEGKKSEWYKDDRPGHDPSP